MGVIAAVGMIWERYPIAPTIQVLSNVDSTIESIPDYLCDNVFRSNNTSSNCGV